MACLHSMCIHNIVEPLLGSDSHSHGWQAGVKHLVFSSLEDVRKYPGVTDKLPEIKGAPGRYVGHWEAKDEVAVSFVASLFGCCGSCVTAAPQPDRCSSCRHAS